MKRNKRHRFSSSKQMLQYGTRNGIGPFARKWPKLVQRQADTSGLQFPVGLGKIQDKETAPDATNIESGKVDLELSDPRSASHFNE